jgi:hypothetical protein
MRLTLSKRHGRVGFTHTLTGLSPRETIPTERPSLVGEVTAKYADRGFHVVSVTDPYGRLIGFLDRSRYYFF